MQKQVEKLCADVIKSQSVPIHRIGFQQLTFGDAPFRVESEWRFMAGWHKTWAALAHACPSEAHEGGKLPCHILCLGGALDPPGMQVDEQLAH